MGHSLEALIFRFELFLVFRPGSWDLQESSQVDFNKDKKATSRHRMGA